VDKVLMFKLKNEHTERRNKAQHSLALIFTLLSFVFSQMQESFVFDVIHVKL